MDKLQKELDQITKRRAELVEERDQAKNSVAVQEQKLSTAMLAGSGAASSNFDALTRDKLKADALQSAIFQADDQIKEIKQQIENEQRAAWQKEFDRVKTETKELIKAGVSQLYGFQSAIEAIDAKIIDLRSAGAPFTQNIEFIDDANRLLKVTGLLKNAYNGVVPQNCPVVLQTLESEYRDFVQPAPAKTKS